MEEGVSTKTPDTHNFDFFRKIRFSEYYQYLDSCEPKKQI